MKKLNILPIVLLYLVSFSSCTKENDSKTDSRKTYLTKVSNNIGTSVFSYNAENKLIAIINTAADGVVTTQNYSDFNVAGLPTKSSIIQAGETTTKEMEYDDQNRLTKITVKEAGSLYKTVEYTYTANTMEYSNYNASGNLWGKYTYTIDVHGNVLGYLHTSENTLMNTITCNAYDNKKSLNEFYYQEDTKPFTNLSTNNIISYQSQSSTGESTTFTYTREYNSDGYPTKQTLKILPSGYEITASYEYIKR